MISAWIGARQKLTWSGILKAPKIGVRTAVFLNRNYLSKYLSGKAMILLKKKFFQRYSSNVGKMVQELW